MEGIVKYFNEDKGFGFINTDSKNDYFFHVSEVESNNVPIIGTKVEFIPNQNEKGNNAKEIKIIEVAKQPNNNFLVIEGERIKISNIKQYGISKKERYYQRINKVEAKVKKHGKLRAFLALSTEYVDIKYGPTNRWTEISSHTYYDGLEKKVPKLIWQKKDGYVQQGYWPSNQKTWRKGEGFAAASAAKEDGLYRLQNSYDEYDAHYDLAGLLASPEDFKIELDKYLYINTFQNDNYTFYQTRSDFDVEAEAAKIDQMVNG